MRDYEDSVLMRYEHEMTDMPAVKLAALLGNTTPGQYVVYLAREHRSGPCANYHCILDHVYLCGSSHHPTVK